MESNNRGWAPPQLPMRLPGLGAPATPTASAVHGQVFHCVDCDRSRGTASAAGRRNVPTFAIRKGTFRLLTALVARIGASPVREAAPVIYVGFGNLHGLSSCNRSEESSAARRLKANSIAGAFISDWKLRTLSQSLRRRRNHRRSRQDDPLRQHSSWPGSFSQLLWMRWGWGSPRPPFG